MGLLDQKEVWGVKGLGFRVTVSKKECYPRSR